MTDIVLEFSGPEGTEARSIDAEAASLVCRPTTVELLRAIAHEDPSSIRETARIVGRDVRQVHDNLWTLGEHGIVEFEREGRSRRPVVNYDRFSIDVEL